LDFGGIVMTDSNLSQTTEVQIGKMKYIVNAFYKADGRETADEKYLRYVTNRVADEIKKSEKTSEKLR
jgi:hypothetical protein